jgi:hypothetical protein
MASDWSSEGHVAVKLVSHDVGARGDRWLRPDAGTSHSAQTNRPGFFRMSAVSATHSAPAAPRPSRSRRPSGSRPRAGRCKNAAAPERYRACDGKRPRVNRLRTVR